MPGAEWIQGLARGNLATVESRCKENESRVADFPSHGNMDSSVAIVHFQLREDIFHGEAIAPAQLLCASLQQISKIELVRGGRGHARRLDPFVDFRDQVARPPGTSTSIIRSNKASTGLFCPPSGTSTSRMTSLPPPRTKRAARVTQSWTRSLHQNRAECETEIHSRTFVPPGCIHPAENRQRTSSTRSCSPFFARNPLAIGIISGRSASVTRASGIDSANSAEYPPPPPPRSRMVPAPLMRRSRLLRERLFPQKRCPVQRLQ